MKVSLFIKSEVLRYGIHKMLEQLPVVNRVEEHHGRRKFFEIIADRSYDLVIACDRARPPGPFILQDPDNRAYLLHLLNGTEAAEQREFPVADGFLLQEELTVQRLETALRQALSKEASMPSRLAHILITQANKAWSAGRKTSSRLTEREMQTLGLLAEGLTNRQIAARLKISENGAKRLVSSVMSKLGSTNRASAVANAIKEGLIDVLPTGTGLPLRA